MNREEIIRMAREARVTEVISLSESRLNAIERFAALVATAEREACAKVCDAEVNQYPINADASYSEGRAMGATVCAAAIRARGQS